MIKYIAYYYIIINLLSFIFFALDKLKARKNKFRISETVLHLFSFLGGVYGSLAAMVLFRHKIRKTIFIIITALAFVLHTGVIGFISLKLLHII